MTSLSDLPLRQKILLSVTMLAGLFILYAYHSNLMSYEALNLTVVAYGMGVPMFLLVQDTMVDLNNTAIFKIWGAIGFLFVIGYFLSKNNPDLGPPASALKALPLFLLCYWPLNYFAKKRTGNYLINTYKQPGWQHDIANRKIDWYDVLINIFFAVVIVIASVIEM
jgi:hypothetical protein